MKGCKRLSLNWAEKLLFIFILVEDKSFLCWGTEVRQVHLSLKWDAPAPTCRIPQILLAVSRPDGSIEINQEQHIIFPCTLALSQSKATNRSCSSPNVKYADFQGVAAILGMSSAMELLGELWVEPKLSPIASKMK